MASDVEHTNLEEFAEFVDAIVWLTLIRLRCCRVNLIDAFKIHDDNLHVVPEPRILRNTPCIRRIHLYYIIFRLDLISSIVLSISSRIRANLDFSPTTFCQDALPKSNSSRIPIMHSS
jgi:hypothetical protein